MTKYEILSTIFNGGVADFEMLEKCNYRFKDVWEKMQNFIWDQSKYDFSDILVGCFDVYRENIYSKLNDKIEETYKKLETLKEGTKEFENNVLIIRELEYLDPSNDIEYDANSLCANLFIIDEDIRELYKTYLEKEIKEENEKIGFCELDLEE